MEKGQDKQDGVAFDSYNIGRREKADYFVNVKEKPSVKKTIKKFNPFLGKRKFIAIPVIIVVVVLVVLVICYIAIWSKPAEYVPSPENEPSTQYERDLSKTYQEAQSKITDGDYNEAIAYLDDLISASEDLEHRIRLIMMKTDLYFSHEDWSSALSVLLDMEPSALGSADQLDYYFRLQTAYLNLGEDEKAEEAFQQANAISTQVDLGTNEGAEEGASDEN